MGIAVFDGKGKKVIPDKKKTMQFLDSMIEYAESARAYYKQGFPPMCITEIGNVLWYAENIKERIKRDYPEYWEKR